MQSQTKTLTIGRLAKSDASQLNECNSLLKKRKKLKKFSVAALHKNSYARPKKRSQVNLPSLNNPFKCKYILPRFAFYIQIGLSKT